MVVAYGLLPLPAYGPLFSETATCVSNGCVGCTKPLAVVQVIHGVVFRDAEVPGSLHGIDVRAEEKEFPALLLLALDELAHLVAGEAAAGVLHAVRSDDE